MKAEDIIEGLNKFIEDRRCSSNIKCSGHIVLQRIIESHPTFKAYKSYNLILWFVRNNKKYKVLAVKCTKKVIKDKEESIMRDLNTELSRRVFEWIITDSCKQVIEGVYGDTNE